MSFSNVVDFFSRLNNLYLCVICEYIFNIFGISAVYHLRVHIMIHDFSDFYGLSF